MLTPHGSTPDSHFPLSAYRQLAELRFRVREFLHFSEQAAREHGFEPQQHQLLLAVKGLPAGVRPTITALSARLCLRHHSTVELVDRMVAGGMILRQHNGEDRREALIEVTAAGEGALAKLSILHWQQLQKQAPALTGTLKEIIEK